MMVSFYKVSKYFYMQVVYLINVMLVAHQKSSS